MIGVVNRGGLIEKLVSRKTLPNRSRQGPDQAVRYSGVARSDQLFPWQPWFGLADFAMVGEVAKVVVDHRPS